jgi:uncharacterized phage protein (TIGR02220 family)
MVVRPYQTALLDEHPLIILPTLAKVFGLNEAVIIQQMHYWLRSSKHEYEGKRWIYNTYSDWHKQIPFLSERTIRRTITHLERSDVILSGNFNRLAIDQTKWYTLNYDKIDLMVRPDGQSGQPMWPKWPVEEANLAPPIPETTTETTSENTSLKDIPFDRIIEHLNKKCGTNFRSSSETTKRLIRARWNEGFRLDDFLTVIDKKSAEWLNTSMAEYLRPQTLFGTKFEAYLNTPVGGGKSGRTTQVQEDGGRKVTVTGNQVGRIRTKEL